MRLTMGKIALVALLGCVSVTAIADTKTIRPGQHIFFSGEFANDENAVPAFSCSFTHVPGPFGLFGINETVDAITVDTFASSFPTNYSAFGTSVFSDSYTLFVNNSSEDAFPSTHVCAKFTNNNPFIVGGHIEVSCTTFPSNNFISDSDFHFQPGNQCQ